MSFYGRGDLLIMPISDADVGITEILGSHRPFRAVLKQTVNDFVVNEVLLSGQVARLTQPAQFAREKSLKRPNTKQSVEKHAAALSEAPIPSNSETSTAKHITPSEAPNLTGEIPYAALDALFPAAPLEAASNAIRTALASGEKQVVLPPTAEKATRTAIHAWVRENLPAFVTDTVQESGGQAVRLRSRSTCRPWKRRRVDRDRKSVSVNTDAADDQTFDPRENRDSRGGQNSSREGRVSPGMYVSFVLWKRHIDTMEAVTNLSRILRLPVGAFSFAGTKDKRAVTTQLVHVRGVSEGRLAYANRVLRKGDCGRRGRDSMAIGNVTILPDGEGQPLRLGDLLGNRFTLALKDLEVNSHADEDNVRAAVESLRTRGFVNYFGLQRFGSGVSGTHETGFSFLRGDFEDVCRRILMPLVIDESETGGEGLRPERKQMVSALEKFSQRKMTAKELLPVLPRWMHVEKALITSFCHDEEQGFAKYDYKSAFGKLPRNLRRMYGHAVQSYLWNKMASERINMCRPDDASRMHAVGGDLVPVNEEDIAEFNYETQVRPVTAEEETSRSVSIFRVVVPVLGSEVGIPNIAYGRVAKKILDREKIDLQSKLGSEYGMRGTYRPLLAKARDVEMQIRSYSDGSTILIPNSIRPCSDEGVTTVDCDGKETKAGNAIEEATITETNTETEDCRNKKALIISFTLGCAEYATMLVRELTKKDSSTVNQKSMQSEAVPKPSDPVAVAAVSNTARHEERPTAG